MKTNVIDGVDRNQIGDEMIDMDDENTAVLKCKQYIDKMRTLE
jgi:hypothetical protein